MAIQFIPNPDNLPCVNHIDGNKLNNCLENLEWCTHSGNMKHAFDLGLNYISDEQRDKFIDMLKSKAAWNKGRPHPESTRKAISNGLRGKMKGEGNGFYGKKHTKEAKEKIAAARRKNKL